MGIETALIGGGAMLGSALLGSDAAGDAADSQAASTAAGIAEQQRQFDLQREDSAPYRQAGARALGQYEQQIAQPFSAADALRDPGYQFGLQQGQQALDRKIAAMGGRVSGAALKAASRYGTDYGSTKYGEAYQRRQDSLNRLAALAGLGQTATANSSAAGQSSANAISGLISSQGDANAAARMAQGSIWGGAGNQIAALAMRYGGSGGGAGAFGGWGDGNQWATDAANVYG